MYFPSVNALPLEQVANDRNDSAKISERILIVEEEPTLRDVLHELLIECGYTVEAAGLGLEALEIFVSKPDYFDLIITDVIMPGMSGPQFIEEVRKHRKDMKVIFTSGCTDQAIGRHGVLDSDQNFLSKPYKYDVLDELVRRVLDK